MFRATMCPSSGATTVFVRHLVLVILCGWLSGIHPAYQTVIYTEWQEPSVAYSCFSWWWAHSRPKHVHIDKYTKNKLCAKLVLFTGLYRDKYTENKLCDKLVLFTRLYRNKYTENRFAPSWFYLQDYTEINIQRIDLHQVGFIYKIIQR